MTQSKFYNRRQYLTYLALVGGIIVIGGALIALLVNPSQAFVSLIIGISLSISIVKIEISDNKIIIRNWMQKNGLRIPVNSIDSISTIRNKSGKIKYVTVSYVNIMGNLSNRRIYMNEYDSFIKDIKTINAGISVN